MPTSRLEAFSDGVFAIAITLLVLEIPVPHVRSGELAHELVDQWPIYAAYVVSFATVGIIWINHHAVFGYLRRADRGLLFLNLLLLLWVALIPWPTALLAEYMRAGGGGERAAALVYALTMTLMGVSFGGMWLYATRRRELGVAHATPRAQTRRFVLGTPIYALSIGLALVSAPACSPSTRCSRCSTPCRRVARWRRSAILRRSERVPVTGGEGSRLPRAPRG